MSLSFHKEIFRQLLEEDALVIMGQGLGMSEILFKMILLHCHDKSLVFILNLKDEDAHYIEQRLIIEYDRINGGIDINSINNNNSNTNVNDNGEEEESNNCVHFNCFPKLQIINSIIK